MPNILEARCETCGWGRQQEAQGAGVPPDGVLAHLSLYPDHQMHWGVRDPGTEPGVQLEPLGEHEQALAKAYRAGWDAASKVLQERAQRVLRVAMDVLA